MEAEQTHYFIKTIERPGEGWVAMMADATRLGGRSGVDALRSALKGPSTAFNAVRLREGVHFYSSGQLSERIPHLEAKGMDKSVADHKLALQRIQERTVTPASSAKAPMPQRFS